MYRAVFLDRDGTLIEEKEYLHRPEEVVLFPGAGEALRRLQDAGFKLFIVTNQSGVGRGYFTLADVEKVHHHLVRELVRSSVRLDKIYVAPEAPEQPSRGRKPSPQFLFDARDEFGVDLAASCLIGDKLIDLECGWNAGVKKCLLVRTGYGKEVERTSPDKLGRAAVVGDLGEAAEWILGGLGFLQQENSVRSKCWQRLKYHLNRPMNLSVKTWTICVAGTGIYAAKPGQPDKFIPWDGLVKVRRRYAESRNGLRVPLHRHNSVILRQIRSEWQKRCPEAHDRDQKQANEEFRRFMLIYLPPLMIVLVILKAFEKGLNEDKSLDELVRKILVDRLWAYILGGLTATVFFWGLYFCIRGFTRLVGKSREIFRSRRSSSRS